MLGVPFPTQVPLPSVQIVSLVAGGMYVSFCLSLSRVSYRSPKGHSMRWTQMATFMSGVCDDHVSAKQCNLISLAGTLNGSTSSHSPDFSKSSKQVKTPMKLKMPAPIRSIR